MGILTFTRKIPAIVTAVVVMLAFVFLPAPKANAALLYTTGDVVLGQYPSGDVAWYKMNIETGPSNQLRVVIEMWCDNSNGAAVNCNLIEGTDVNTLLLRRAEGSQTDQVVQLKTDYLDAANVHVKRFEHAYSCVGIPNLNERYRAQFQNAYMISRFGEGMSGPKDRTSGFSPLYNSCV